MCKVLIKIEYGMRIGKRGGGLRALRKLLFGVTICVCVPAFGVSVACFAEVKGVCVWAHLRVSSLEKK